MRKALALEMVGKMLIGVLIAVVGISLVMTFLGVNLDLPGKIKGSIDIILHGSYIDSGSRVEVINSTYTEERLAEHIKRCWDSTRLTKQDMPCFVLQGNFSSISRAGVLSVLKSIDPKVPPRTNITSDFGNTDLVLIHYDYSDDIIDVKS